MIEDIRTALSGLGYVVHDKQQEKLGTLATSGEIVVVLDDTVTEIETTLTYHQVTWVTIEWNTVTPDTAHDEIVSIISTLEPAILAGSSSFKASFKFIQSEINKLGLMYRVILTVEYKEVINLG